MRLDKFLKVSRLVKRRTIANLLCDAGRVSLDDKPAKAGAEVRVGQQLEIKVGEHVTRVEIVEVPSRAVPAQEAERLYKAL